MAKPKLPIYDIEINESEFNKSGVQYVALVDQPAVEMDWLAFSEEKKLQFVQDKSRHIITGVLMRANYPIFRSDEQHGDYYVRFKKPVIELAMKKFAKLGYHNNVNIMHNPNAIADGVYMIESFMVDKTRGISAPDGLDVEDGSWIGSYYVENPKVWAEIEAGTFKGFSVEGFFGMQFLSQIKDENSKNMWESEWAKFNDFLKTNF